MTTMQLLQRDGFALVPHAIDETLVMKIVAGLESAARDDGIGVCRRGEVYALRNALEIYAVRAALPQLRSLVAPILGEGAFAVRGIVFDKTPDANWKVAWHQDLSIAVREQRAAPDFRAPSCKAGVAHVQPPPEILQEMLTLRLHLDACDEDNAPLRVVPRSHLWGIVDSAEIAQRDKGEAVACVLPRGGALLMRPLILHASSAAVAPNRRRVLHLEWARDELPHGLRWRWKH